MKINKIGSSKTYSPKPVKKPHLKNKSRILACNDVYMGDSITEKIFKPEIVKEIVDELTQEKSIHKLSLIKTTASELWDKIELIRDCNPNFKPEAFRDRQKYQSPELQEAFGRSDPASTDFLLHYAKGWDTNKKPVPVLLVPGAAVNGEGWVSPEYNLEKEPLGKYLSENDIKVFAITFSNNQGDNYYWAQQIANAIERIKKVTGSEKVDIVAHSKGGIPARMYVSNFKKDWMTSYKNDVRNLIMLGVPNLGVDYGFRHSVINYGLYPEIDNPHLNAPMSWEKILYMGVWHDSSDLSINKKENDYFPGQRQLLYRWDNKFPISPFEQDWWTTYYGGMGFASFSKGIEAAIKEGGNFIEKLRQYPVDKDVKIHVIAGSNPETPFIHNEHDGPSDGVVFIDSATYTEDMVKGGAKVVTKKVIPTNHLGLRYDLIAEKEVKKILD